MLSACFPSHVVDIWDNVAAGIRIFCTQERSQLKNKERALSLLRAKLFELESEKQRAEISARRKSQVCNPSASFKLSYNSLQLAVGCCCLHIKFQPHMLII